MLKLHLGCGKRLIPGFIHVDIKELPHVDEVSTISDLSRFRDNSAELIYCCHTLEHIPRREVIPVLTEWRRVLAPGGVLRISVPDFEKMVQLYSEYKDLDDVIGPIVGGQRDEYDFHKTLFDEKTLIRTLTSCHYKNPRIYDADKTDHAFVDDYSRARKHGVLISLNMEATK